MKKSILTKLSALGVVLAMTASAWVTCLSVPASDNAAKAATIATTSGSAVITENVKPASYLSNYTDSYGTKITFNESKASVTFAKTFTIKEGDNSIIKLASHPSEDIAGKAIRTGNLERLTIKVEKVADASQLMTIDFATNLYSSDGTDDWTLTGTVGLRAYGPGQKVAGYAKKSENLRDYGSAAYFSFNQAKDTDVVEFTYNAADKTIKSNLAMGDSYPTVFRDFDKACAFDSTTWDAFAAGDKVKVTVSVVDISSAAEVFVYTVGGEDAIAPLSASVTSKAIAYDAEAGTGAVKYTLPVAKCLTAANAKLENLAGKTGAQYKVARIADNGNATIVSGDTETEGNDGWVSYADADTQIVLLTEVGKYRIYYRLPVDGAEGEYYETSVDVEAVTKEYADSHPVSVVAVKSDWTTDIRMPGYDLEASALISSAMDVDGFDTTVKKFYVYADVNNNGAYDEGTDTAVSYVLGEETVSYDGAILTDGVGSFALNDEGTFFVVYEGVDGLGRTSRSAAFPVEISYKDHKFVSGSDKVTAAYGSDSVYFTPSAADIDFYDLRLAGQDANETYTITIKKPSESDYVGYDANFSFDKLGDYSVKYVIEYNVGSAPIECTLIRTLTVADVTPPTLSATRIPTNTVLDNDKISSSSVVYLRAKKGATITLPEIRAYDSVGLVADLNSEIQYFERLAGATAVTNKSTDYIANKTGYTVTLGSVGEYVFTFRVFDSAGNTASLIYNVDVREKWLSFELDSEVDTAQNSGSGVMVPQIRIVDFNGNATSDGSVTTELKLNGTVVATDVAGKTLTDLAPGEYELVYTVTETTGVSYTKSFTLTITDTSKPVVTAQGIVSSGKTGKAIALATFAATDNDVIRKSTLSVTFNGEEVNTYDGAFIPSKPGRYVVTYSVEDVTGNIGSYFYTVNVTGKAIDGDESGLPAWAIVLIVVGSVLVLAVAAFAVLVILNKKGITHIAFIDKIWNAIKKPFSKKTADDNAEAADDTAEEASDEDEK